MKYVDRRDKWLIKRFQEEELEVHREDREVRENKRIYKKQRSKYLRRKNKVTIKNHEDVDD